MSSWKDDNFLNKKNEFSSDYDVMQLTTRDSTRCDFTISIIHLRYNKIDFVVSFVSKSVDMKNHNPTIQIVDILCIGHFVARPCVHGVCSGLCLTNDNKHWKDFVYKIIIFCSTHPHDAKQKYTVYYENSERRPLTYPIDICLSHPCAFNLQLKLEY